LQWLQNPHQTTRDNFDKVRYEAIRTFRNKKKKYLKEKLMSLEQTEQKYQELT